MDSFVAIAVAAVVLALALWAVFGDDPAEAIYSEDDDEPADARRWRDPWGDCE